MKVELSKRELSILLASLSSENKYTLIEKSENLNWIKKKHKGENLKGDFQLYKKLKLLYNSNIYEKM